MRLLVVVLMGFALAGCFRSDKPLIAAHEAEYPIATPMPITAQAKTDQKNFRIERRGDLYVMIELRVEKDGTKKEIDRHHFLMRGIGDGKFIAQQSSPKGKCPCNYGLIQITGKRIAVYEFEYFGERIMLTDEEMARFGVKDDKGYTLSSFDQTAALFRYLLERPRPDRVYKMP